jgi:antitoxin (DNA-binding transcriptional repressor) of toxin-antitoxin stability system
LEILVDRISITHLARNLADVVNRVAYRGERFTVIRGGRPVVELVPPAQGRRLGDLSAILTRLPPLGKEEAENMGADLDEARAGLGSAEGDPWAF